MAKLHIASCYHVCTPINCCTEASLSRHYIMGAMVCSDGQSNLVSVHRLNVRQVAAREIVGNYPNSAVSERFE